MQVVFCRDLLHRPESPDRPQHSPRLALRAVEPFLRIHASVGLGYTPETSQKLTSSLATDQRTTSIENPVILLRPGSKGLLAEGITH